MKKLYISLFALVTVVAMLAGATMAWFTATDNAGNATFTAGTVSIAAGQVLSIDNNPDCTWTPSRVFPKRVVDLQLGPTYNQLQGIDTPINPALINPEAVLSLGVGNNWGNFTSLGFGGHITVEFDHVLVPNDSLVVVVEDTYGSHPAETANVFASMDGQNWVLIGTASNQGVGGSQKHNHITMPPSMPYARYIKVVDTSDPDLHAAVNNNPGNNAGFDLNAVFAEGAYTCRTMNWNPGDCNEKSYIIDNTGSKGIHLKAEFSGQWYEYDSVNYVWMPWTPVPDNGVVTVTLPAGSGWLPDPHGNATRFYYDDSIASGGSASLTVKVCLAGENTDNQYQGKRFILSSTFSAIQSSNGASQEVWGVTITP